jgi:nitrogen fixation/metabolism regulation signal transduction histidine kinase
MAVTTALKRLFSGKAPIILLLVLLLGSLYLMSGATENSEQFSRIYIPLLIINTLVLLLLVGLIAVNLGRLVRQYRSRATGSRLTARLVVMFVVLAVTPVSVLYYFSLGFIRHGIDSWFDVRVEQAMSDALELSRTTLDWRLRDMLRQTEQMATVVSKSAPEQLPAILDEIRQQLGAREVSLLQRHGDTISFSSTDVGQLTPNRVDPVILAQLEKGLAYVALEPERESASAPHGGLFARLVVNVPLFSGNAEPRLFQVLFPVPAGINLLMERVQNASSQYERLAFFSGPLKFSFTLTLSLVLLLTMFTAIWVAFYLARRLVAPIRVLAIGTRSVAEGDYRRQLPTTVAAADELGFLVKSFNTMMTRIALAREEAERSRQSLESQKSYLETVLAHLSSGVMTFSGEGRLLTANAAAEQILGVELKSSIGAELAGISQAHEHMQALVEMLLAQIGAGREGWQEQVALYGATGRQVLMCRGVHLPTGLASEQQEDAGYVVVFDDVTTLLQAQRDAAWGEVARRIAHEIKNPLTPIRLSAERLRHKYLPTMGEEESQLLDRATHTIVQQVDNMKELVKAFADYARAPQLELRPVDLNALVNEVLELYRSASRPLLLEVNLDPQIAQINADSGRIRQLIHNLVKNAIEAVEGDGDVRIKVETRRIEGDAPQLELSVTDNGPGIPDELLSKIFEPYVSTKPKGDGLGLAIVKKIVEEHNGALWAENLATGGARFNVRLPLQATHTPVRQPTENSNEVNR